MSAIVKDDRGRFKKGFSGNPKGRPKGSKNRTLNYWLRLALNHEQRLLLEGGVEVVTTPAEMLSKILVKALTSGVIYLEGGQQIQMTPVDFLKLVDMTFRQVSPPTKQVEMRVSDAVENLSDEELLRVYAAMDEENPDEGEEQDEYDIDELFGEVED